MKARLHDALKNLVDETDARIGTVSPVMDGAAIVGVQVEVRFARPIATPEGAHTAHLEAVHEVINVPLPASVKPKTTKPTGTSH